MDRSLTRPSRGIDQVRVNHSDLVMMTVSGKVAHPVAKTLPYRIGYDGVPRILPGTGGIVVNFRVGDRCVGLAGDHIEPGVSLRNEEPPIRGDRQGNNLALNLYSCVGNRAVVTSGPCEGSLGTVCGKHGGVNHVLVDFPSRVLRRLRNEDSVQVYACGTGMRLLDHPRISVMNCSPRLMVRWGLRSAAGRLHVPVTGLVPAAVMGSGLGRNNAAIGDYDIQLIDRRVVHRYHLNRLRFGDFVAVVDADTRFGRSFHPGFLTIGIVVHSDSTVSGHGPGVVTLLSGSGSELVPVLDPMANIARVFRLRPLSAAGAHKTLVRKDRAAAAQRVQTRLQA